MFPVKFPSPPIHGVGSTLSNQIPKPDLITHSLWEPGYASDMPHPLPPSDVYTFL